MGNAKTFPFNGNELELKEIARISGVQLATLRYYVSALGETAEEAVRRIYARRHVNVDISAFDTEYRAGEVVPEPGEPGDVPVGHPDLKALRHRKGLTTKMLSIELGIRDDTYRMIEAGFVTHPEIACRIGAYFGLTDAEIRTMIPECRYAQVMGGCWIRPEPDEEEKRWQANKWSHGEYTE